MTKAPAQGPPLAPQQLALIDRYWKAANYLSVGQIYLMDNPPLLRKPLEPEHIKPRLLGHWGTTPGLNFIYAHLNRIIRERNANIIYICGPGGHGGPGMVANTYLEGSYSEIYPGVSEDEAGMRKLFRQFSFPGGIPSHVAPETPPGSIHEGGELGYALVHAYGAAFDNPDLVVACVVGDGEAETGTLAASWHSNKFLNPARDGAVLPILHLNGYKIANPTILARLSDDDLTSLFRGYGYEPFFVEGSEPEAMHQQMAATLDAIFARVETIKRSADVKSPERPRWPMIILRSPKGWTGPKEVDGLIVENYWRSHQVPVANCRENDAHRKILENWMKSYDPEDLFDEKGALKPELRALAPQGERRMGAGPHANGGLLRKELHTPDFRQYAVEVTEPGALEGQSTKILGEYLRDVLKLNEREKNFRVFGPDETASNRLGAVFDASDRVWMAETLDIDDHLSADGRIMEVLSENLCQGWLEGYLLTGRHGFFSCYEAFIHIVDSMFNQHAKWLQVARELKWRKPISSLNYLLTSHVWRQDHNGFSHQDPGFVDLVANKSADIIRVYFPPPDANTLLWVADHCLKTWDRINVIVAGKQPEPQWLSIDEAVRHCEAGLGIWDWAGTEDGLEPDIVMACAGDVPTMEVLAAVSLLRQSLPHLRIRVVNVVDLMVLQSPQHHPHGIADDEFDRIFTTNRPVIFAYHGYPYLIHRLVYKRTNHSNFHVHGFIEQGTTTTPFDMTVLNELDRFHLAMAAVRRLPIGNDVAGPLIATFEEKLVLHKRYVREHGEDMPEIRDWKWDARL
ncbi:phosphoketolase [Brucella intermedia 229E]|uniref:Probable phosphoketolase n=1 Tax=Brucella intermedia 229E TaxID=1337887 RepID=U4V6T6_9HYPH|nr:phosphoketolase [Brucella intermedia 229E]